MEVLHRTLEEPFLAIRGQADMRYGDGDYYENMFCLVILIRGAGSNEYVVYKETS